MLIQPNSEPDEGPDGLSPGPDFFFAPTPAVFIGEQAVTSRIDQIPEQQTREFAHDCLETKSVAELKVPHTAADADPDELDEWGLAPEAWSEAMDAALHDLKEETESLFQQTFKVEEDIALGRWCASCNTPWGIATHWGRDREEARAKLHSHVMGTDAPG